MMSKKIMIVDDSKFMRGILKEILINASYEIVREAEDGNKAVAAYKELKETENRPEIIFMDITMPDKDGIEATREIMEFDSNAVIIICSSNTLQESVFAAIQAGAKLFIAKPFDATEVIEKVEKVIKKHME